MRIAPTSIGLDAPITTPALCSCFVCLMIPSGLLLDWARVWSSHEQIARGANPAAASAVIGSRIAGDLIHQDVAELPGVAGVERLRKQFVAADEWCPIGI